MSKKKDAIEAIQEESAATFKERIKELEAKVREGEERALERVCKALGTNAADVKAKEVKKTDEKMVRMFVSYPVQINAKVYAGDITVPYEVSRVISQALGDRKQRLLRELTGNDYILKELQGGGFSPQLIGRVDISGERIA